MRSVSSITNKLALFFLLFICSITTVIAQENSPYSRYGIGDLAPNQNILSRGIGNQSAAIREPLSVNSSNPASYTNFFRVIYDIGVAVDARTLKSQSPVDKYKATNFSPAYVGLGFPVSAKRKIGAALGLKPFTRINYSIVEAGRLTNIDSIQTLYEGSGGLNQAFAGLAKRWGGLSVGANVGFLFGKKQNNTRRSIINTDTVFFPIYYQSNHQTNTSFSKFYFSPGFQYEDTLARVKDNASGRTSTYQFTIGGSAMLKQNFRGSQDLLRETFVQDGNGGSLTIDSVYETKGTKVDMEIPSTYTFGVAFNKTILIPNVGAVNKWMIGAEFETAKWTQFRYAGLTDKLNDYWQLRIGGSFLPKFERAGTLALSTYRAGLVFGQDYINADGKGLKTFSANLGIGVPIAGRGFARTQFTILNLAAEFGKRGTNINNVTETFFRVSAGLSFSDIWFIKRKYD